VVIAVGVRRQGEGAETAGSFAKLKGQR
jgi:hypothetical protein